METYIKKAAELLQNSKYTVAFTGAGISAESGIPTFRSKGGVWTKHDTSLLNIDQFYKNPKKTWEMINEIFYLFINKAKPNNAHYALAELEKKGLLTAIITQNIDNLHQHAGNTNVYEYHGTSKILICKKCNIKYNTKDVNLSNLPPICDKCKSVLKPNFIFFGEGIPQEPHNFAMEASKKADVFLVIGTTGKVMPASLIPIRAQENGAKIIEVNIATSEYTNSISKIFLKGKASIILPKILKYIK